MEALKLGIKAVIIGGEEVIEEVLEGPQSVIRDEAENRLHVQNAVMALIIQ